MPRSTAETFGEDSPNLLEQRWLQTLRSRLLSLSRYGKQALMAASDGFGSAACVFAAYFLVEGTVQSPAWAGIVAGLALISVGPIAYVFGLYRSIVRFIGADLYLAAIKTAILLTAVLTLVVGLSGAAEAPGRWGVAFGTSLVIFLSGSRFLARAFLNRRNYQAQRVILYGAGSAGARLASALHSGEQFNPIAFVDDNPNLHGRVVNGLEVHRPSEIRRMCADMGVSQILLAMPSISRRRRRKVLERLTELPVHVQTVPDITDLITGNARVDDIREVAVEDLLGRDAVPPNPTLLSACIEGKAVMVTGAGGSIGSELCRQILALKPKLLILFDSSEAALYSIDRLLRQANGNSEQAVEIVPLMGSVHHRDRVCEVMTAYGVQTVYHAAAYKHVPMVEHNVVEGVHNNVFGTLNAARAAMDAGVETFVLISTDKAVKPTNVMGATKRFAELALQALHHDNTGVRFCMVRFGNVLASSGSVVPLFREQICGGGPVTVTHPEIIRYFMTIPEAAQLVIQAGSMATGGDVFVLDMGKPVKILDLARRMVHLMGLTVRDDKDPDGDIEIEFTGLRPAEKLYEELLLGSDVAGTEHPRILRANEDYLPPERLNPLIDELWTAARSLDSQRVRAVLLRAVNGYKPTNDIEDLVFATKKAATSAASLDKVTDLSSYRDHV